MAHNVDIPMYIYIVFITSFIKDCMGKINFSAFKTIVMQLLNSYCKLFNFGHFQSTPE